MANLNARLLFEVKGRDARDLARHLSSRPARSAMHRAVVSAQASPVAFAAAALMVVGAVSGLRQAADPANVIVARHVIVFEDVSGSMANVAGSLPATEQWMRRELEPLAAYGVKEDLIRVNGFGVLHDQTGNFLHALVTRGDIGADAVYLFSDFDRQTHAIDDNDDEGFDVLRDYLRAHHLRLYLRTVLKQPAPRLLAIAHESGGDFIGEP